MPAGRDGEKKKSCRAEAGQDCLNQTKHTNSIHRDGRKWYPDIAKRSPNIFDSFQLFKKEYLI